MRVKGSSIYKEEGFTKGEGAYVKRVEQGRKTIG